MPKLPPELSRLILAMPSAPQALLAKFREDEQLHGLAHALSDILGLEEDCDELQKILAAYDDHALTLLLFHMGAIRPSLPVDASGIEIRLFDDEEDGDENEDDGDAPPDILLN